MILRKFARWWNELCSLEGLYHMGMMIRTHWKTSMNCAENREAARRHVLATSDADAFLFMDSDIVLPEGAVEEFVKQCRTNKSIIGGWYPFRNDPRGRWAAGRWIADNTFHNFTRVQASLVKTDMVGLGCAFITREALSNLRFEHVPNLASVSLNGETLIVEECGAFGNLANEKGYELWMDGSVVCGHLDRARTSSIG
jgi:Glycosyl transferase family 2